jgi:hypothetical protein
MRTRIRNPIFEAISNSLAAFVNRRIEELGGDPQGCTGAVE